MTPTAGNLSQALESLQEKVKSANAERAQLVKELQDVISQAQSALSELGQSAEIPFPNRRGRRGRPPGSRNKRGPGRPAGSGRKKRQMSAEARKAISEAQKARWAKQKAGEKKK